MPPRRPCRPPIYLAWEFGGHTTLHAPPRATWVSGCSSTHRWTLHAPATCRYCCWCHLTSYDDVITPCQQPCKNIHISPSPRHQTRQQCRLVSTTSPSWPLTKTDPTRTTRIWPVCTDRWLRPRTNWLWLFALTFNQKSKFPTGLFLLNLSRRFQFWTPFLCLKL